MPPPPLITRPFLMLIGAHFLQALGWTSMLLLPLHLDRLGATRTGIGVIMAISSVGGLLLRPLIGWSLDSVGRKPTLVVGTFCLAGGAALLGVPTELSPLLLVARLLYGVGSAALFTGYFALASDLIPEARRTEGIALFGISGLAPLAVNGFAGGLAASGDVAGVGLRAFFPLVACFVLSSLLFLAAVPAPPLASRAADGRSPVQLRAVMRDVVGRRTLWPTWLATSLFSGQAAVFFSFATVTGGNRGVEDPSFLWIPYALGAVLVRAFGARLPDRVGTNNLVAPTVAAYAGAALLVAASSMRSEFLLAGFLAGAAHGYAFPVLTSQVVGRAPVALRGTALAMFTGLWELSDLVLAPSFGLIADATDDATMFASLAVAVCVGLGVWAVLEHRKGPAPEARGG